MELHIVSTDEVLEHEGRQVRLWMGKTDSGLVVGVLVASIAIPFDAPRGEVEAFERELEEQAVDDPQLTQTLSRAFERNKETP